MVLRKPVVIALGTALVIAVGLAFWFYYANAATQKANARLEQSVAQKNQTITDLEKGRFKMRQSRAIDRELHRRLEKRYQKSRQQEQSMRSTLAELRENENAGDYFATCPMPDSVYQWVRKH